MATRAQAAPAVNPEEPTDPPTFVEPWRNRITGQGRVDPRKLTAHPDNWRVHPDRQRDVLRGSLAEVGWVQQILVNRTTGHVIDGHARLEEALEQGEKRVPVLYVELSDEEERLVLATLDPISAMAGVDQEKLDRILEGMTVDDAALRELLGELGGPEDRKPGLTDPDDVPDPLPDPGTRAGDVWALGDHRLMVGDSTEPATVAALLEAARTPSVDLIWTDPPYGVAYVGKTGDALTIENDAMSPTATRELVRDALRLAPLRPGATFYIASPAGPLSFEFMAAVRDAGLTHRQTLVWVKDRFVLGRSDYHYRHEPLLYGDAAGEEIGEGDEGVKDHDGILYGWAPGEAHAFYGGRRLDTVWEIERPAASRAHPTMKPAELVARALEYSTRPGATVYDPFVGSGTTVIAAEQLGRRAVAIEIDPVYARVTIDRWERFTGATARKERRRG